MFSTILPPILFGLFFVGFIILAAVLARKQERRARELLTAVAGRLGLELKRQPPKLGFEPTPTVKGTHRGRNVRFFSYTTGSGKNRTAWCAVSAASGSTGSFTLDLCPENFLTRIATTLGMQDLSIGDAAFDEAFMIKSNDPAAAAAMLLPEIRARLLAQRQPTVNGNLSVKDGEVRYAEHGSFDSAARVDRMAAMLELACDLAEVTEVYRKA
jgi:hypothetical protein